MPDGNSPELAGESLPKPTPSVPAPEADAPIAQASTEKPQRRPLWIWIAGGVLLLLALYEAIPWAITVFRTESTDDAYVNGHVTFVAPRRRGWIARSAAQRRRQRGNFGRSNYSGTARAVSYPAAE